MTPISPDPVVLTACSLAGVLAALAARRELAIPLWLAAPALVAVAAACFAVLRVFGVSVSAAAVVGVLLPCCLLIAEIDRRSFLIPDALTLAVLVLSFGGGLQLTLEDQIGGAALIGLLFIGVRAWFGRSGRTQALGLGDVKLAGAMGAFLGVHLGLVAIAAAGLATLAVMLSKRLRPAAGIGPRSATLAPFGVGLSGALLAVTAVEVLVRP